MVHHGNFPRKYELLSFKGIGFYVLIMSFSPQDLDSLFLLWKGTLYVPSSNSVLRWRYPPRKTTLILGSVVSFTDIKKHEKFYS
jgi:hypothetical protein